MIRPKFSRVENFITKTESIINDNLNIYPNPSYNKLKLNYYVDQFSIYDKNGKILIFKNEKSNEINIKRLDAGNYIILLKSILSPFSCILRQFLLSLVYIYLFKKICVILLIDIFS